MDPAHRSGALKAFLLAVIIAVSSSCSTTPTVQATATFSITYATTPTTAASATATAAVTDVATSTPASSPTAAATRAAVTASPTADNAINPFTGLPIDAAAANRRPMLVKVANTSDVRPQTGLSQADVVFEHYSEGGITRFTALFLTNSPEKVGSVRSCRLIDLELPVILGAGEVCSGTSAGVRQRLKASKSWEGSGGNVKKTIWMISDLGPFECRTQAGCKLPMFRTPDRVAPHNLFANTLNAWKELDARGLNQPTTFNTWRFNGDAGGAGEPARAITIPYTSGAVTWAYDAGRGQWMRSISGKAHADKLTGQQLGFANVVVAYANHVFTNIIEDSGGSRSIEVQLWGQGPLKVFRDGKMIEGTWRRDANGSGIAFVDANGGTIALKPGTTWIELVPLPMAVKAS
jgi:hypothetical protein